MPVKQTMRHKAALSKHIADAKKTARVIGRQAFPMIQQF